MKRRELASAVVAVALLSCASGPEPVDPGRPASPAVDDRAALREALGPASYDVLVAGIGADALDRLSYGVGQSNIVALVNAVSDPQKLVALMSGPGALTPKDVIDLLTLTDAAVAANNTPSSDTIAKIANVLNHVIDMHRVQQLVHGMTPRHGKSGMERLALLIALTDEQVSTMPTLINECADTDARLARLLRILDATDNLASLVTIINGTSNLLSLTGLINNLTDLGTTGDGVAALVGTLNYVTDPLRFATLMNSLSYTGLIGNDDDFEAGDLTKQNWATAGDHTWHVTNTTANGGAWSAAAGLAPDALADGQIAVLELVTPITQQGNLSFARRTSTQAGDSLKFYVDDTLAAVYAGTLTWQTVTFGPIDPGVHRFRWEYQKDASGRAGDDAVYIDDVTLPGDRGAALLPAVKVAVLLNQLTLAAERTVADLLNGLDPVGLAHLAFVLNRTAFPADVALTTPRLVAIVNNLSAVGTLVDVLNGTTDAGVAQLVDVADDVGDVRTIYELMNGLSGNPGQRMFRILNNVGAVGASSLIRLLDTASITALLAVMNGVADTAYIPDILQNLDLSGKNLTTVGQDSSPTGAAKMGEILNDIENGLPPGNNLTVAYHMVRLINDVAAAGHASAANVGRLISKLSSTVVPDGVVRMTAFLDNLAAHDAAHLYTSSLCRGAGCTTDQFGRLTTFVNEVMGHGIDTAAALINGVAYDRLANLTGLVANVRCIRYMTDVVNQVTNPALILAVLNDPTVDVTRMRRIIDTLGDQSYPGVTPPSPRYTDALSTAQSDGLGRLAVLINEVVTPAGATSFVAVVSQTADLNKITGLVAGINEDGTAIAGGAAVRIRYLSDIMNHVENVTLLMNTLNGPAGLAPADYARFLRLVNEVGGTTKKGRGAKPLGDTSIVWGTMNLLGWNYVTGQPRTALEQSRMITLVNTVGACGVQPGFELNQPWNHLLPEPCTSGYGRLSEFMIGMNDAYPVSVIVGDVTVTSKTVKILNGFQVIDNLVAVINQWPGEVTSTLLNTLRDYDDVIYGSALYLFNALPPAAVAAMAHFGTGIGEGSQRNGTCDYFTGIGPVRLGKLLNVETGPRLEKLITNFGWRTSIPAMTCGFGVKDGQTLADKHGRASETFAAEETLAIDGSHYAGGAWQTGVYTHHYQVSSGNSYYNCQNYYPETVDFCTYSPRLDRVVWSGYTFWLCLFYTVTPGITSAWDIVNGDGFIATLFSTLQGTINYPPLLGTTDKNWPACQVRPDLGEPAVQYKSAGQSVAPEFTYPALH